MRKKRKIFPEKGHCNKIHKKIKKYYNSFFTLSHLVSRGLGPEAICTLEEAGMMSI
jgi:hypothetical protein